MDNSRRSFLLKSSLLAIAGMTAKIVSGAGFTSSDTFEPATTAPFTLPALPYDYSALEPHIDRMTMEIHHSKHHQAYVTNLNKALTDNKIDAPLEELVKNASKYPPAIRNNGGGHWNHSFFWKLMTPGGGGSPAGKIDQAITSAFSSFEAFKSQLEEAGLKRFGSGWAWLILDKNKKLVIGSTPNQDNPLMDVSDLKGTPILAVDVWEHAYYLKYQNKRVDYLKAWWNVINWNEVNKNLEEAQK